MSSKIKKRVIQKKPTSLSLSPSSRTVSISTYEADFYKWTTDQSKLLKRGEYLKLDIDKLIEEIESLGNSDRRALESYFKVLLLHLLKIKYQPDYRTKSWEHSVKASRYQINKLLKRSPSLSNYLSETIKDAYFLARLSASDETSLNENRFPKQCPWSFEECMKDAGLVAEEVSKGKKQKKKA